MNRTLLFGCALVGALAACSGTGTNVDVDEGSPGVSEDDLKLQTGSCLGKSCGDRCTLCNGRPGCFETAVLKSCNAEGRCSPQIPVCKEPPTKPYDPCGGKTCGEQCHICPPWDPTCIETAVVKQCNAAGQCSPHFPVCDVKDGGPAPYQPCAGKSCGDRCQVCPPWDLDCVETAVLKQCHDDGTCSPMMPACTK